MSKAQIRIVEPDLFQIKLLANSLGKVTGAGRLMSLVLVKILVLCALFSGALVNISVAEGASIKARDEPLTKVLLRLEKASGIRFIISDSLLEENISANIQGSGWTEVAQRLLDGFNIVGLTDGDNKLIKVFLLSRKTGYVAIAEPVPTRKIKRPLKKSEIVLTVAQLRKLVKGPFRSPLPVEFFNDPGYRGILSRYGIESRKDMESVTKAMRVRAEARRQLRILNKKS